MLKGKKKKTRAQIQIDISILEMDVYIYKYICYIYRYIYRTRQVKFERIGNIRDTSRRDDVILIDLLTHIRTRARASDYYFPENIVPKLSRFRKTYTSVIVTSELFVNTVYILFMRVDNTDRGIHENTRRVSCCSRAEYRQRENRTKRANCDKPDFNRRFI